MVERLQDRTVRIELPLENNQYSYFSGYILTDGLIITCYHGFTDTEGLAYACKKPIVISSFKYPEVKVVFDSPDINGFRAKSMAYYSEAADIAVLKCETSVTAPLREIYNYPVRNRDPYDSGGFPTFKRDLAKLAAKGYKPFYGNAEDFVDGVDTFSLNVESTKADKHRQWKAISGGPVLIHGKLAGIIKQYDEEEGLILAVSLHHLLSLPEPESGLSFRRFLLGLGPPKAAYFEGRVKHLFQQRKDDLPELIKEKMKAKSDEQLLVQLISLDREEVLSALAIFSDKQVGDLACLLLSLTYANEAMERATNEAGEVLPYFDIHCARQEACELLLAFHSARDPLLYVKSGNDGTEIITPGKYCINTPPENGIGGPSAEEISKDLLAGTAQTINIAERLYKRWNEGSEEEYYEVSEWVEAANILLHEEAGKYYWRLPRKEIHDTSALSGLLEKLPALKIVKIKGGVQVGNSEKNIAQKLKPLLSKLN